MHDIDAIAYMSWEQNKKPRLFKGRCRISMTSSTVTLANLQAGEFARMRARSAAPTKITHGDGKAPIAFPWLRQYLHHMEFLGLRSLMDPTLNLDEAKKWWKIFLGVDPYFDEPFYVGFKACPKL